MSEKKINYLARDFNSVKKELLQFSQLYYPEMADSYNDSSVGAWFIDLMSAVADDLSYHTDRMYNETNVNSANLRSSVLNTARTNGVKIPGPKASVCEIEISCVIPSGDDTNISQPDWKYAPVIKQGGVVSNGSSSFELVESVDFGEQFNQNGVSNRRFSPIRDKNGIITAYTVSKTVIAIGGKSVVYKKVISEGELKPFMEIILPEQNIMNVESILFKEGTNFNLDPDISEYYVDEEEYKLTEQANPSYRYFEVDSLAVPYRLGFESNKTDTNVIQSIYYPYSYDDYYYTNNGEVIDCKRFYKAQWKPLRRKFITEYTDNGYLKIIFGGSTRYDEVSTDITNYGQDIMSKIVNNDMLGLLPKAGWTMYVLYRTGGGVLTNVGKNSITNIINFSTYFKDADIQISNDAEISKIKQQVQNSIKVTNVSNAVAGKNIPSTEEIKYLTKYTIGAQDRCVTLKDYKAKLMMMPPKFGTPFRCGVFEHNNKIEMHLLGMNAKGKLDPALPQIMVDNIKEYMSHYKNITDYIEIKSGKVYNLGIGLDIFVDKSYATVDVIARVIDKIKSYFDVNKYDMGDDIFVGDLEKEITQIDGVISIIDLRIYSIYGGNYSPIECPLPKKLLSSSCCYDETVNSFTNNGANFNELDLSQCDYVLFNDHNAMFEILNDNDIQIRCKTR